MDLIAVLRADHSLEFARARRRSRQNGRGTPSTRHTLAVSRVPATTPTPSMLSDRGAIGTDVVQFQSSPGLGVMRPIGILSF